MLDFNSKTNLNTYLNQIGRMCENQLKEINIPIGNVLFYDSLNDEKWGECQKYTENDFVISINSVLINREFESELCNTIIHELLHTCPDCYNHGAKWTMFAKRIKECFNYDIKVFNSCHDKNIDPLFFAKKNNYKYILTCKKCGESYFRRKGSRLIKDYDKYRCSICGGDLRLNNLEDD